MRILTVRQPWAWAIIHGGKDVENRVRNVAGSYRGPVAIHAAMAMDLGAFSGRSEALTAAAKADTARTSDILEQSRWMRDQGTILGVVELVDAHLDNTEPCNGRLRLGICSEWAEPGVHHLVLERPRALAEPMPYRGALGLRALPADVVAEIEEALRARA